MEEAILFGTLKYIDAKNKPTYISVNMYITVESNYPIGQ